MQYERNTPNSKRGCWVPQDLWVHSTKTLPNWKNHCREVPWRVNVADPHIRTEKIRWWVIRSYQSSVAAGTVSKVMMMQLLPVLRDSVHTSMYYAKRLLTPSCSLSLSLSLSSCTWYVLVQYSMYYTSTYRNSPGAPPIAFVYKGGVAWGAKVFKIRSQ